MAEHGTKSDQPMYRHLSSCDSFKYYVNLFSLADIDKNSVKISIENHILNAVNNYRIIDYNSPRFKWNTLLFLEAYYIKKHKPLLNQGLKATKEFMFFT